ncbi:hypothetical protein NE237_001176 [Protea cynaroides]|uniref:Uncharacterized protein n=1 Tax=Protea cynaroides TaxID=273540 RepID=A0A9Q0KSU0_9MAGN|nr:hypothetical protein NE237_001176 [Protea cynaroides]
MRCRSNGLKIIPNTRKVFFQEVCTLGGFLPCHTVKLLLLCEIPLLCEGFNHLVLRIIAYCQLMQVCQAEYFRQLLKPVTPPVSDQQTCHQQVLPPLAYHIGGSCMRDGSMAPGLGVTLPAATKHLTTLHGVELQPLEVCPKNFIVFDRTVNKSRIMFHPGLAHKFSCLGPNIQSTYIENEREKNDEDKENIGSFSSLKEDTEDIDALLSLEEEGQEDGDEISTARTLGSCGSTSSDSCSNYGSKPSKQRLSSVQKFCSGSSSCNGERKRLRMKKMIPQVTKGGSEKAWCRRFEDVKKCLETEIMGHAYMVLSLPHQPTNS